MDGATDGGYFGGGDCYDILRMYPPDRDLVMIVILLLYNTTRRNRFVVFSTAQYLPREVSILHIQYCSQLV